MNKPIHASIRIILVTVCVLVCLLGSQLQAAVTYWDPEGTYTGIPATYTGQASTQTPPIPGTLAGTWETTSWSTASGGAATPVAWVESTAACFAVGAGATNSGDASSTTTFTITMNQNHTVAGMFNGSLSPNSCRVTIQGAGTMNMVAGNLNAISLATSTDGSTAWIALDVPIAGGTTAGICAEQNGEVFLNGNNSGFAGGTYLGYNGSAFAVGVWHFNDIAAFGTSPIILLNCIGGALVTETSGLTITNAVTMYNKSSANVNTIGSLPTTATLNLVASPAGVNFSGPWALSGGSGWTGANIYANTSPWGNYTTLNLAAGHGNGDPTDRINISGKLSGTCVLTKLGSGILELSGDNRAFSGPLTIANGTLRVGYPTALGCDGALTTNGTITVTSGTFNATNTYGTLDLNGYAMDAALVLNHAGYDNGNGGNGALVNSNLNTTAVLNAPNGVLSALVTAPYTDIVAPPVSAAVTGGGGSGATAYASLGVTTSTFTITPGTQKYTVVPAITVSAGGGSNAIVAFNLAGASPNVVATTVTVTAPGSGFSSAPTVTFTGGTKSGSGTAPTISANGTNFQVVGVQITAPGSGYTSQPSITLSTNSTPLSGATIGLLDSVTLGSTTTIGGPGNIAMNSPISDNGSFYGLTMKGSGTVSLGGVNTYLGATTISAGKLVGVVGGSCSNSAVEVQTGIALGVSVPDNTKQWTCASLTFDDSTTTSEFDFGSVTPSITLAPLNVTGSINFNGTPTVTVLAASSLPAGTYPLMTCTSGFSGTAPTTANLNLPPHVNATLTSDGFTLSLVVVGNTEPLKWAVNGPGVWDINATANWKDNTGTAVKYLETAATPPVGDSVVLDDTYISGSPTITLNTTVTPVAVAVNSAHNYTISGTGGVAGQTDLSKQGAGTLELDCVNTYSGDTTIAAPGALTIGGAGQLGGGAYSAPIFNDGTLNYNSSAAQILSGPISGVGALAQGNGTLILSGANSYSGGTTVAAPATLQIGDGVLYNGPAVGGNIADNGSLAFANFYPQTFTGNLSGSGSFTVWGPTSLTLSGDVNSYAGTTTINAGSLIFNNAASQTLAGDVSGAGALVQAGPGTLTLSGNNSYTGGTTIRGGILSVYGIDDSGFNPSAIGTSGNLTLASGTLRYTGSSPATTARTVSGSGAIDLPAGSLELQLAKSGTITNTSGGTLTLSGTADNASLGLNVSGGMVILNKASASTVHAIGAATTVNNGGKLQLSGTGSDQIFSGVTVTVASGGVFDANGLTESMTAMNLNGTGNAGSGALINGAASTTSTLTGTAANGFPLQTDASLGGVGNLTLAGVVSGAHALSYVGSGTLTLTSACTYTGGTTISSGTLDVAGSIKGNVTNAAGVLKLDAATSLATTATVTLAGSPAAGAVNLNFTGTQTINALYFGATQQASGTWGATGSSATHQNAAFTGLNGVLSVTTGTVLSTTNVILSITNNGNGTFTLKMLGTPSANYYLASSDNVANSMAAWIPVVGSTNSANGSGNWSFTATNAAPAFYRSIAVNPAP